MSLTFLVILLALLFLGAASASAAMGLGNIMCAGGSITRGMGAGLYRWQMHKMLVGNGRLCEAQGIIIGNYSGGAQTGA